MSAGPHGNELFHVDDRAGWRAWLERNHASAQGVWVVTWRAQTGKPRLDLVEAAKADGSWSRHDAAEALEIPADLEAALAADARAAQNFKAFTDAAKRAILRWLIDAKRPETRAKRIEETARLAARNERAGP